MAYLEMLDNPETENIWIIPWTYKNAVNIRDMNSGAYKNTVYTGNITVKLDVNDHSTAMVEQNYYPAANTGYIQIPETHDVRAYYEMAEGGTLGSLQYDKLLQENKTLRLICSVENTGVVAAQISGQFRAYIQYAINVNLRTGTGSISGSLVLDKYFLEKAPEDLNIRARHSRATTTISASII